VSVYTSPINEVGDIRNQIFHQAVNVSFRLVSNPRKQVVDNLFEAVLQLCPQ